jgi:hypothetical protein
VKNSVLFRFSLAALPLSTFFVFAEAPPTPKPQTQISTNVQQSTQHGHNFNNIVGNITNIEGITLAEYEASLQRQEREMREERQVLINELKKYQVKERTEWEARNKELEKQLNEVESQLKNIKDSYRKRVEELQTQINELGDYGYLFSEDILKEAQIALTKGDDSKAKEIYNEMSYIHKITIRDEAGYSLPEAKVDLRSEDANLQGRSRHEGHGRFELIAPPEKNASWTLEVTNKNFEPFSKEYNSFEGLKKNVEYIELKRKFCSEMPEVFLRIEDDRKRLSLKDKTEDYVIVHAYSLKYGRPGPINAIEFAILGNADWVTWKEKTDITSSDGTKHWVYFTGSETPNGDVSKDFIFNPVTENTRKGWGDKVTVYKGLPPKDIRVRGQFISSGSFPVEILRIIPEVKEESFSPVYSKADGTFEFELPERVRGQNILLKIHSNCYRPMDKEQLAFPAADIQYHKIELIDK